MAHMQGNADKIVTKGLYKSFGSNQVLKGVDLAIKKGSSLVVLGGSGTGKSVLVKNILGLQEPDKGEVFIDGKLVTGRSGKKNRLKVQPTMKMLFQGGALFDSLTVAENVTFGLKDSVFNSKTMEEFALGKLLLVGLNESTLSLYPSELSGGMQKRVSLARTIASDPEIIFFDEPTTGLDPIMSEVINELIIKVTKHLGATAITITHDLHSARKIATDIAMLYKGEVIWQGTPSNLDTPKNPIVEQFVQGHADGAFTRGLLTN